MLKTTLQEKGRRYFSLVIILNYMAVHYSPVSRYLDL